MGLDEIVKLRVLAIVKADWQKKAKSKGLTLSAWIIERCKGDEFSKAAQKKIVATEPKATWRRIAKPGELLKKC